MAKWKINLNLEKVEETLEDKNKRLQRYNKISILIILLMALGFLIYELKFDEKGIFDKGDKYEEYDPNYIVEDDSNISQSANSETSNVVEGITSNLQKINDIKSNNSPSNTQNNSNIVSSNTINKQSNSSSNNISLSNSNKQNNVASNNRGSSNVNNNSNSTLSPSFENDSWSVISTNVKNGNTSNYKVGDTKVIELDMNKDGKKEQYKVRIANMSKALKCSNNDFSQTSCGFVVEFVDLVANRPMNETLTNTGGWKDSQIRSYLNGEFYNNLPSDLKKVIIDTKVISGHGPNDTDNFNTTDKIYLFTSKEIWVGSTAGENDGLVTDNEYTKTLDYYSMYSVMRGEKNDVTKKLYNGQRMTWLLRSAIKNDNTKYRVVYSLGTGSSLQANKAAGVAPGFRIG